MVNQTSGFKTNYTSELLDSIRKDSSSPAQTERLWNIACMLEIHMRDALAECSHDNLVGLLPYVSDTVEYYRKKIGKEREVTFELSNVGAFKLPEGKEPSTVGDTWTLKSMTFTQGATPVGPPFNVNCISVQGGPLTIAITWQDGITHDGIIDALEDAFKHLARNDLNQVRG